MHAHMHTLTHSLFLLLWLRAWWTDRQAEGIWYSVSGRVDCLILEAAWWGAFSASASQLGLQSTKLMANKIVCLCPSHVGPTRRELSLSSGINEQKREEEEEGGWGGAESCLFDKPHKIMTSVIKFFINTPRQDRVSACLIACVCPLSSFKNMCKCEHWI